MQTEIHEDDAIWEKGTCKTKGKETCKTKGFEKAESQQKIKETCFNKAESFKKAACEEEHSQEIFKAESFKKASCEEERSQEIFKAESYEAKSCETASFKKEESKIFAKGSKWKREHSQERLEAENDEISESSKEQKEKDFGKQKSERSEADVTILEKGVFVKNLVHIFFSIWEHTILSYQAVSIRG